MPGLCLTVRQACRLWQVDPPTCDTVLATLLEEGFLHLAAGGRYIARGHQTTVPAADPIRVRVRMAPHSDADSTNLDPVTAGPADDSLHEPTGRHEIGRVRRAGLFLVDAFRDELEMYAEFLTVSGFAVETFDNANRALAAAERDCPDLMIARIRQAGGSMDGIQLSAGIRRRAPTRNLPVILLSTSICRSEYDAALAAGCTKCILLPVIPEELFRLVVTALGAERCLSSPKR